MAPAAESTEAAAPALEFAAPAIAGAPGAGLDLRADAAPRRGAPRATRTREEPAPRHGTGLGWVLLLAVVLGLAAGAYYGREQIVASVPATAELYRMAGLPVTERPGAGLELRDVKSVRRVIDGERVVVIEGAVANLTDQPRAVPRLRASVTDAGGTAIDEWMFSADLASLPPGGVTRFETSTKNAPREGSLAIDFIAD